MIEAATPQSVGGLKTLAPAV